LLSSDFCDRLLLLLAVGRRQDGQKACAFFRQHSAYIGVQQAGFVRAAPWFTFRRVLAGFDNDF
jgi:hypothetical protein